MDYQSSFPTHIFDLPPELINELMSRMDRSTRYQFGGTCRYFRKLYKDYETKHSFIPYSDDEDSFDYDCDTDSDSYTGVNRYGFVDEDFDRLSFGSNYESDDDDDFIIRNIDYQDDEFV